MPLSKESITANEQLKALPDEQINALVTLSENEEQTAIANSVAALRKKDLSTLAEITGNTFAEGSQFSEQFKTVVTGLVESSKKAEGIADLENQITTLKQQLKEGSSDEALKQQLQDAQTELAAKNTAYTELENQMSKAGEENAAKLNAFRVANVYDLAGKSLKFKPEFKEVSEGLLKSANATILSMFTPGFSKGLDDKEVLVFRKSDKSVHTNPNNLGKPYTYEELLAEQVKSFLMPDTPTGLGTKPVLDDTGAAMLDLTGANTREKADELIEQHLMRQGKKPGTVAFQKEFTKIREDNKVSALPMR